MNWTTTGTLPAGLALDPNSGIISGTPTSAGTFSFLANVSDGQGNTGTQPFTIVISPASVGTGPLVITPSVLPSGTVGQAYSVQLGATLSTGSKIVFPADHILNTPIDKAPVLANSDAIIAQIQTQDPTHTVVHPGFEIPINEGIYPLVTVTGLSFDSDMVPYAVPANPLVEGNGSGDGHMLARQMSTNQLYEIFVFNPGPPVSGASGATFDLNGYALRTLWNTSADAAGLPIYPLLIRYSEFAAGVIPHALRVTMGETRNVGSYAGLVATPPGDWPARHRSNTTNTNPNSPAMGTRFRLKASFDDSGLTANARILTACFKKYGLIVADGGSSWFIQGDTNPAWTTPYADTTVYASLTDELVREMRSVPASAFEVVDGVTPFIMTADSAQAKQL